MQLLNFIALLNEFNQKIFGFLDKVLILNTIKLLKYFLLLTLLPVQLSSQWVRIENLPQNMKNAVWTEIFTFPGNSAKLVITGYDGAFLMTTDRGNNWEGTFIDGVDDIYGACFYDDGSGFLTASGPDGNSFILRYKGGEFTEIENEAFKEVVGICCRDSIIIMTGGEGCLKNEQIFYRSDDNGKTWDTTKAKIPASQLTDIANDGERTFAVSSGIVWESNDSGESWKILAETGGKDYHRHISVHANSILVPYAGSCNGTTDWGGMRFSPDLGKTWREFRIDNRMYGCCLVDENKAWACGSGGVVYFTSDTGATWGLKDDGTVKYNDNYDIAFTDDTTGYIAAGSVIYKYAANPSYIRDLNGGDKIIFFPNPFYERVELGFRDEIMIDNLRIYDMYGRLLVERKNIAGKFMWNVSSLSSGIYYYRIISGKRLYSGKLIHK